MTKKSLTARIEVFRSGTFTPMQGKPITFAAAELRAIADAYDPQTAPAPVVVGHPSTDAPAFGWIEEFDYDASGDRLSSSLTDIAPEFAAAVKAGRYRKVSLAFFSPDHAANPVPGTWYPKHLGFLGGAAPAVPGLKNVQFSGDDDGVVTFAQNLPSRGGLDLAALLASFAEFLSGREADPRAPVSIDWQEPERAEAEEAAPAAPQSQPDPNPAEEKPVSKTTDEADFAAKEADIAAREAALDAREARARHDENVAFAESLVESGQLIPASLDAAVAVLDALPSDEATVAFAAGSEKISPAAALRKLLSDQPKVVDFSALRSDPDAARAVQFASDGQPVDAESLEILAKAQAYQAQHQGVDLIDAVRAVKQGA